MLTGSQAALKASLREELKNKLAELDPAAARRAAERVTSQVLELPEVKRAQRILTCLSFGDELSTWGIVDALLASKRQVYVPRASPSDRRLHIHPYPCELRTLIFGLRQPPVGAPELPTAELETLDAILVLGLAFDQRGYRLGYGSGYFDRFLAGRLRDRAIGLTYDLQLVARLPAEFHDVPMPVVVSEKTVLRPGSGFTL